MTLALPLDATPHLDSIRSDHHLEYLELIIHGNVYEWSQTIESFVEEFRNISS